MVEANFQGQRYAVELRRYGNGRPGLVLVDPRDGEPFAVASVNLHELAAATDEVFIKDYSENEGMLAALEAAGVVRATGERVRSGFLTVPRAKLQPEFLARVRGGEQQTQPPSPASAEGGVYQIWLNDNPVPERIHQMFGHRWPEFPNGFIHLADVVAASVGQAYSKAHAEGNILDPHDTTWKDWQKNEGVRVLVPDVRGADFGDVIVSPDGQAHQLINGGFRDVPRLPLREPRVHAEPHGAEVAVDAPSPSAIAADNRLTTPELSTGHTKGKKP